MKILQFHGRRIWEHDNQVRRIAVPLDQLVAITESYVETTTFTYRLMSAIKVVGNDKAAPSPSVVQKMNQTEEPRMPRACPICHGLMNL